MSAPVAPERPLPAFVGDLLPHQAEAVPWLLARPRCLLGDDVGLGKSVTTAALLGHLADAGRIGFCLLVVPAALIAQRKQQLGLFVPSLSVAGCDEKRMANPSLKDHKARRQAWGPHGRPDIEIATYEGLRSRIDGYTARGFSTVVFDEAQEVKGRGPEHEAATAVYRTASRVLALSATPVALNVLDTWGLLHVVGAAGLPTEAQWGQRYVVWSEGYTNRDGQWVEPRPQGLREETLPELRRYLATVMLRRTAADAGLRLPRVEAHTITVRLTPAQQAAYDAADGIRDDLRRSQAREQASGWAAARSAKAEAAVALIGVRPGLTKVVMWSDRLDHLTIAADLLTRAGIQWVRVDGDDALAAREAAVHAFREEPAVRVLLGSDVIGKGLNLQNAQALISLGSSWSPAVEQQRVGRIRRIGSEHTTVYHFYVLTKTEHEEAKQARLLTRAKDLEAVLGL